MVSFKSKLVKIQNLCKSMTQLTSVDRFWQQIFTTDPSQRKIPYGLFFFSEMRSHVHMDKINQIYERLENKRLLFYFILNKFDNFFLPKQALMYGFLWIWQLWLRREMVHRSPVCLENWKQMLWAMAKSQISSLYSDFMRLSGSKNFPAIWSSSKSRIFQDWSLRSRSIYLYMCHLNHPQYLQRPKPKIPSAYWGKFEINTWKTSEALARLCKE